MKLVSSSAVSISCLKPAQMQRNVNSNHESTSRPTARSQVATSPDYDQSRAKSSVPSYNTGQQKSTQRETKPLQTPASSMLAAEPQVPDARLRRCAGVHHSSAGEALRGRHHRQQRNSSAQVLVFARVCPAGGGSGREFTCLR